MRVVVKNALPVKRRKKILFIEGIKKDFAKLMYE